MKPIQVPFQLKQKLSHTSSAEPTVWMIRSKILVLSTSKDRHWRRHLYIRQAETGLPLEKPRSCEIHFISRSWFSCAQKEDSKWEKTLADLSQCWFGQIHSKLISMGSWNPKWNTKMSLRFKFASQVSYNHLLAAFHLEISVAFPRLQWLPVR